MSAAITTYGALAAAIVCEIIGTSFLKQSEEFTRLVPTAVTAVSYACAFYFLTVTLRTLPVGIAYAIWSGLGVVLISVIGRVVFKQQLDLPAYIGLGLIVAGVLVVNIFSKTASH